MAAGRRSRSDVALPRRSDLPTLERRRGGRAAVARPRGRRAGGAPPPPYRPAAAGPGRPGPRELPHPVPGREGVPARGDTSVPTSDGRGREYGARSRRGSGSAGRRSPPLPLGPSRRSTVRYLGGGGGRGHAVAPPRRRRRPIASPRPILSPVRHGVRVSPPGRYGMGRRSPPPPPGRIRGRSRRRSRQAGGPHHGGGQEGGPAERSSLHPASAGAGSPPRSLSSFVREPDRAVAPPTRAPPRPSHQRARRRGQDGHGRRGAQPVLRGPVRQEVIHRPRVRSGRRPRPLPPGRGGRSRRRGGGGMERHRSPHRRKIGDDAVAPPPSLRPSAVVPAG